MNIKFSIVSSTYFFFLAALTGGCATTAVQPSNIDISVSQNNETVSSSKQYAEEEVYGPTPLNETTVYGPEPLAIKPVVLVLGSGWARSFASAGAIRALVEEKIPIGAVFATEMGALIGSLYVFDSNINSFEWTLQRFNESVFDKKTGIFSGFFNHNLPGKKLEALLKQIFEGKDLRDTKVPFYIGIALSDPPQEKLVVDKGDIAKAVRAGMSTPGLLAPSDWNGKRAMALSPDKPFLINEARLLGLGPVVVLDASVKSEVIDNALDAVDVVIRPDLSNVDVLDFDKSTEIIFRGKMATMKKIAEIKHFVGLPTVNTK